MLFCASRQVQMLAAGKHQLLTEKVDANCSSQSMTDPEMVTVTIPSDVLVIGATYRSVKTFGSGSYCVLFQI